MAKSTGTSLTKYNKKIAKIMRQKQDAHPDELVYIEVCPGIRLAKPKWLTPEVARQKLFSPQGLNTCLSAMANIVANTRRKQDKSVSHKLYRLCELSSSDSY